MRRQLARAAVLEIEGRALVAEILRGQRVIAGVARVVLRKGRVRREQDALLQSDVVDRLGDLGAGRIGRKFAARLVVVARRGDRLGRAWRHFVRPLQVMEAVQRLVDRVGVRGLIERIRGGRIEVLGRTLRERGEEGVGLLGAVGMRAVGDAVASGEERRAREQQDTGAAQCRKPAAPHGHPVLPAWSRPCCRAACSVLVGPAKGAHCNWPAPEEASMPIPEPGAGEARNS